MERFVLTGANRDSQARCADLARRWLTACQGNICLWKHEALVELTDDQLADSCIAAWGLDQPQGDENDLTWFEVHNVDRTMLIEAFSATRAVMHSSSQRAVEACDASSKQQRSRPRGA